MTVSPTARQGPFRPQANGDLAHNEYAWNKLANMVFVEQPVGVGFSVATSGELKYGDAQAAADNLAFVKGFFSKFSQLKQNKFFITSESYVRLHHHSADTPSPAILKRLLKGEGDAAARAHCGCRGVDQFTAGGWWCVREQHNPLQHGRPATPRPQPAAPHALAACPRASNGSNRPADCCHRGLTAARPPGRAAGRALHADARRGHCQGRRGPELRRLHGDARRCHSAAPPSPFSRRFNSDGEGVSAKW